MLKIHLIKDVNDPYFLPWLDLYETAFPPNERGLVSETLKLLQESKDSVSLAAALDERGEFVGMFAFDNFPEISFSFLWYLAIVKEKRHLGLGSALYQEIVKLSQAQGMRRLIFEVELPEHQEDAAKKAIAEKRIQFYKKQGAKVLHGVHYMQQANRFHDAIPMHVMVHCYEGSMRAGEAWDNAKYIFGDNIKLLEIARLE
jgi:GNAT superfamily N-acetyltransferase